MDGSIFKVLKPYLILIGTQTVTGMIMQIGLQMTPGMVLLIGTQTVTGMILLIGLQMTAGMILLIGTQTVKSH